MSDTLQIELDIIIAPSFLHKLPTSTTLKDLCTLLTLCGFLSQVLVNQLLDTYYIYR